MAPGPVCYKDSERDRLEVASKEFRALIEMIPVEEQEMAAEKIQQMMALCNFLIEVVGEIAGRLKYTEED